MPFQPALEENYDDRSPLEYARTNGLSQDHRADKSGFLELERLRDKKIEIEEGTQLAMFDFGPEPKIEERLQISKDAAFLIRSVVRLEEPNLVESRLISLLEEKSCTSGLKLELPLLRSDHETDCRKFGCREEFDMKIEDIKLPIEEFYDKNQESLVWPPQKGDNGATLIEKLNMDRLVVTKEAVAFLQQFRKGKWAVESEEKSLWESQQLYKRSSIKDPVTPPLSPVELQHEVYQPSSSDPVYEVPVSSDPSSPTKQELLDLETLIFRQDLPTLVSDASLVSNDPCSEVFADDKYVKMRDIYLPLVSADNLECSLLTQSPRLMREGLKVEEALIPESVALEHPKCIDLENIAEEINLMQNDDWEPPVFEDKLFEEAFLPAYEEATRKTEQELIMEADVTCRVNVPVMDFSKGPAPWEAYENAVGDPVRLFSLQKKCIQEFISVDSCSWPGSENLNHKLRWNPFSRDLNVNITEEHPFLNDAAWENFVPGTTDYGMKDSTSSVWKPEGLKIAKGEESEEELELWPLQSDRPQDLSSLVKKRKKEMKKLALEKSCIIVNGETMEKTENVSPPLFKKSKKILRKGRNEFELLSGLSFSAGNAVDNFLEIRRAKKLKIDNSDSNSVHGIGLEPHDSRVSKSKEVENVVLVRSDRTSDNKETVLPAPSVCGDQLINLIVSLKIMKRRQLIKKLEEIFPRMNLVERDFSAHNTTTWLRGSVARSPVISPLENEADFIISPTTGVVITSLQKIKQKPLPGQRSQSAIRARLTNISVRYQKLVVLVSEGRADEGTTSLDASDCLAFSEFYGFAIALDMAVIAYFVGGGEVTIAHWLAGIISNYHVEGPDLLQEETYWELFLRRAGFNAFAAQTVIANLKTARTFDRDSPMQRKSSELASFVEMNSERRMERFSPLVGGRIMQRVNELIDSRWNI